MGSAPWLPSSHTRLSAAIALEPFCMECATHGGSRVCSARRGKLNKHGSPAATRGLKSMLSIAAICQSSAQGGSQSDLWSFTAAAQHSQTHWGKEGPSEEDEKALTQFSLKKAASGSCASCRGRGCSCPCQGLGKSKPRWKPWRLWYSIAQTHVSGHLSFPICNRALLQLPLQPFKCQL